jgi:hypothetical protein
VTDPALFRILERQIQRTSDALDAVNSALGING